MDVKIIREWFSKPANLKRLPPGLEKQLQKNGTHPPRLQQKIQPLRPVLEVQSTRLPQGQKRTAIAVSIILMNSKTSIIIDILTNVF